MNSNEKTNGIGKAMLSVSVIVIAAKVAGLLKQIVTAGAFGATIQTDVIMLAEGLISNLDYLLVQALATAFIPVYISVKTDRSEACEAFVSNTIKTFFLITAALSLAVFALAPIIARILAPSYTDALSRQLTTYLRVFSPTLIIIVELAVFNALLKANKHFVPGELVSFNQSVILIVVVLLLSGRFGADTLVIGFICYALFNLLYLMIVSRRYWRLSGRLTFSDENVKKLLIMMGPLLLGYAMIFINQQVDKIIVSGLGEGTVTAMHYASVLSNFVCTFIGSICGVLFTYVTQNIVEKNDEMAASMMGTAMVQMLTLIIPVAALTIMNAEDIIVIVFRHGKFDSDAVRVCAFALIGYAFMFVPFVVRELFSRFQYGYGDSKRPMINSTIGVVFNIIASIVLSRFLGVFGVTLATSISVLICGGLNLLSSIKRNGHLHLAASVVKQLPRWLLGAAFCILFSIAGAKLLSELNVFLRFFSIVAASMLTYLAVAFPLIRPMLSRLRR